MRAVRLILAAVMAVGPSVGVCAAESISAARPLPLNEHLTPGAPTVFVFLRPGSSLEVGFVQRLRAKAATKVGFRRVEIKTGAEPLARQYGITTTPAALVYDRRGRFVGRSSDAAEIGAMVEKAAQVMRIDWAEPGDPRFGEMDKILGRSGSVDVMRTMSLRPEWLRQMRELQLLHRQDSALDGRVKEMIATYVSSLNHCPFCVSGHAANLKKQGLAAADVDAIALGTPDKAQLSDKDRGLLAYVKLLTLRPARVRDPDIEGLRAAGWTDQQLFETSFTVALFSFYNRMADAYGLDYIPDGWQPPQRRETSPTPPAAIEDGAARSEADRPGRNR